MQRMREAFPWDETPRFVLRDRNAIYGKDFAAMARAIGAPNAFSLGQRHPRAQSSGTAGTGARGGDSSGRRITPPIPALRRLAGSKPVASTSAFLERKCRFFLTSRTKLLLMQNWVLSQNGLPALGGKDCQPSECNCQQGGQFIDEICDQRATRMRVESRTQFSVGTPLCMLRFYRKPLEEPNYPKSFPLLLGGAFKAIFTFRTISPKPWVEASFWRAVSSVRPFEVLPRNRSNSPRRRRSLNSYSR
jgi:hypothetical protein